MNDLEKNCSNLHPKFGLCCLQGKVDLPNPKHAPWQLQRLFHSIDDDSKNFLDNIRAYNMMFAFTSMGGKVDKRVNNGRGPYVYCINGQNMHMIGSVLPVEGAPPKFSQLYIHDTSNETTNRIAAVSGQDTKKSLRPSIVQQLQKILDNHNELVKTYRLARDFMGNHQGQEVKIRLIHKGGKNAHTYNLPTSPNEIAALVVGDIGSTELGRDIIIQYRSGLLERISETHQSYLPMQYPLLFPYGDGGYTEGIPHKKTQRKMKGESGTVSLREYFAYNIQDRALDGSLLLYGRKLYQQYLVDAYTMIESYRLRYIRMNQKKLRAEVYNGLADAVFRGDTQASFVGKRVILPSSFTGGARYTMQNYQDAMAICRWAGFPDLFITFTANPKWPEMTRFLEARQLRIEDRPDIVTRIFKMKLDLLIKDIRKEEIFGSVKAVLYTIEFQKRGLPHAHILVFLANKDKLSTAKDIDNIISAEIPNKEAQPELHDVVVNYMLHGPCGIANPHSPCMDKGICTKQFPKNFNSTTVIHEDGYPRYKREDNGVHVMKNGIPLDNRYVIPYNATLLLKYGAHINVERCNQGDSIKYLFKYVNKGYDRVTAAFYTQADDVSEGLVRDEIKMFFDCRYVSSCESVWRILGFDINYRNPSVERLSFHLPNHQMVVFEENEDLQHVMSRNNGKPTMFEAWFIANAKYENAKGSGESYYLRMLLATIKGPTSYKSLRTVNGIYHNSFRDACYALGLLDDDKEYTDGILEAAQWASANYLRRLFSTLLACNCLSRPEFIWRQIWKPLSNDILYQQRQITGHQGFQLSDEELQNLTLLEIEKLLNVNARTLSEFGSMPLPQSSVMELRSNKLIRMELSYDKKLLSSELICLLNNLTPEQKKIYDQVLSTVKSNNGGMYFVYGHGGTGKTYLWNTLSTSLRSEGKIVLNVASSGIASLLLPGGKTAHSQFRIPIAVNEDSICNIKHGSHLSELLINTSLIIWDEAPMANKFCFEALDKSLRDIMKVQQVDAALRPFGGKVILLGGDFRQILPVVRKGSREDIVFSTITSSYLWKDCKVFTLTKNMRLLTNATSKDAMRVQEFANWIISIGDGKVDNNHKEAEEITIPDELLLNPTQDPLRCIIDSTYPELLQNIHSACYFQERAILAPTLAIVDEVNEYVLSMLPGDEVCYLSADTVSKQDEIGGALQDIHSPEFLNSLTMSGLPNHEIKLKVGAPIMLMRNIDKSIGLCNGTRLIVSKLVRHVIEAEIMTGISKGQKVLIPRMTITPSDTSLPFTICRRQFPIMLSFAMTINKSQGQSLTNVGLYLPRPVFTHGQLYVAISRVRSRCGLKILILDEEGKPTNKTNNVVYKEIFNGLT
ncbi:uncharacterized protein LOC129289243 [Prosopis cineraria]|uniref:uncharacterized protein LOC129289243 n=1 Tax=Prosopis cineraria TaxID=364024 RepID=UPI00240EC2C4|nr:uncharacterized protein LOC129289243 [Prosopis cineraria]